MKEMKVCSLPMACTRRLTASTSTAIWSQMWIVTAGRWRSWERRREVTPNTRFDAARPPASGSNHSEGIRRPISRNLPAAIAPARPATRNTITTSQRTFMNQRAL